MTDKLRKIRDEKSKEYCTSDKSIKLRYLADTELFEAGFDAAVAHMASREKLLVDALKSVGEKLYCGPVRDHFYQLCDKCLVNSALAKLEGE